MIYSVKHIFMFEASDFKYSNRVRANMVCTALNRVCNDHVRVHLQGDYVWLEVAKRGYVNEVIDYVEITEQCKGIVYSPDRINNILELIS